jgi:DNA-binding MarR family transcriptional regulator
MNNQTLNNLNITSLLSLSFGSAINELHERLSELGFENIRTVHGFIFKYIATNGATGIELAEHLGITKQAVSKIVDGLEKSGYVVRLAHPTDKRGKIIVLTERGRLVMNIKDEIMTEIEQRWMEKIGAERMHMLKEDLTSLIHEANELNLSLNVKSAW